MRKLLFVPVLLLGFAATTFAADRSNFEVFQDVSKQVNRYVYFTIFDSVSVSVDEGVVTMSGKVTAPYKASDLEKRVAKVEGVTSVRNTVEVLPVSRFDDRLRLGIARALYSNSALSKYALGINPSIHIIVERGRVTLDGVVDNEMDRIIANSVARSSGAFEVTNALKTTEEIKQLMEKL